MDRNPELEANRVRNALYMLIADAPYDDLNVFDEAMETALFTQGVELGDTRARGDLATLAVHIAHMASAAVKQDRA